MNIVSKIKQHLPFKNEKLIIGVSGGVDSMVLLDILNKQGFDLVVCHVNYNLRQDSINDFLLIKKYCKKHDIKLEYFQVDKKILGNIQGEARKIRYKYFKEISNSYFTPRVVIAHHQDDNIETYLLQKNRNIIVEHYGLKYSRDVFSMNILRPMLDVNKQDILNYASINGIKWNEDSTNSENKYLRNKIRNTVLSEMSWIKKKAILAQIQINNKKTKLLFKKVREKMDEYIVDNKLSEEIFVLPKTQATIIIYSYLQKNRYPVSRINKKIINEIIDFSKKTKNIEASLDLAKDFKLKKDHNWYYIIKEK